MAFESIFYEAGRFFLRIVMLWLPLKAAVEDTVVPSEQL